MSDEVILTIAAVAALILVITLFKLLGSIVKAFVITVIAAGALYLLLPRLEQQHGAIGEAARKAREVTTDIEGSVEKLTSQANEATKRVSKGIKSVEEAADSAKKTQEAVEKTRATVESAVGEK